MSSNEPTPVGGPKLPNPESILDVMTYCNCSEERAIILLQVIRRILSFPDRGNKPDCLCSALTMILKKLKSTIEY
jgi:hypothetical protein